MIEAVFRFERLTVIVWPQLDRTLLVQPMSAAVLLSVDELIRVCEQVLAQKEGR